MKLTIDGVSIEIAGVPIVAGADIAVAKGQMAGLIGPNGSGKSTLLRAVYRHLKPSGGAVWVGEENIWELKPRDAARRAAAVPQERPDEFDINVHELVSAGRIPHKGAFSPDNSDDLRIVAESIERVGMSGFVARSFSSLSGGEKQRVLVARALAQSTPLLILDEPTNHLDLRHQLDVLELIRGLGLTTLVALHDLNLAASYCDRLHVMHAGRVTSSGEPEEVLTVDLLEQVFGVGGDVSTNTRTGKVNISAYPLTSARRA